MVNVTSDCQDRDQALPPQRATPENEQRSTRTCEEGESAASVTIAEGLTSRVESSLVWNTNIEVANEEANPVWVRRPAGSRSGKPPAMLLQCPTRRVAITIQMPNLHEVITSRKFLHAQSKSRVTGYLSESRGLSLQSSHSQGKRTNIFPSSTIRHSIDAPEVLNPAMSLLKAHKIGFLNDSLEAP